MDTHQDSDKVHHANGEVHQDTGDVDKSAFSLTVKETTQTIRDAGFTRSERTVSRWWSPNKGILECTIVPLENGRIEKWFVTPASVDVQIEKMQKARRVSLPSHDEIHPDTSRYGSSHQDISSQRRDSGEVPEDDKFEHEKIIDGYEKKVETLESEVRSKSINAAARQHLI